MTDARPERRVNHVLRRHIDCLLDSGGTLTGRCPITVTIKACTLTERNGVLFSESGLRDLVAAIASHVWPTPHLRYIAIDICLRQLGQPIEPRKDR
ncbi:hypothetical protein [Pseudomonas sp. SST3]|uniref:hypothetical protein n=1 Tax=Pseudomonas sp. SST3 TaxID=2267882 RepID=UPI000DFBECE8|nr:hypothetical protein [Pseudomonas sp. SST3]NKQ11946.1 hypothetical protein [Pseudomonas sp. SST3]